MLGLGAALPLSAHAATPLEQAINERVQQLRAEGRLASDERTAWLVHDLVANRPLAQINANTPLQCASLVKPFVIQAYLLKCAVWWCPATTSSPTTYLSVSAGRKACSGC